MNPFDDDDVKRATKAIQDAYDQIMSQPVYRHKSSWSNYGGLSPTDIDAKGMYEYQEPEVDEQGTYYGYKILDKCGCGDSRCREFFSPRYKAPWQNGKIKADLCPAEKHMHGIHFTKRPDHSELGNYTYNPMEDWVLVKCALSGTVVETEQGFRAEHAEVIGVFENGNWQSYQDYRERPRPYSHSVAEERWLESKSEGWRVRYSTPAKGYWLSDFDTSADS